MEESGQAWGAVPRTACLSCLSSSCPVLVKVTPPVSGAHVQGGLSPSLPHSVGRKTLIRGPGHGWKQLSHAKKGVSALWIEPAESYSPTGRTKVRPAPRILSYGGNWVTRWPPAIIFLKWGTPVTLLVVNTDDAPGCAWVTLYTHGVSLLSRANV